MKPAKHNIPADRLASYERLLAALPSIQRKGAANPYTAVNGHMFTLLGPTGSLALRLPKEEREIFLKKHQSTLFESHGHMMPEFVTVPDRLLEQTPALVPYLELSYKYVLSLNAKPSRKKAKSVDVMTRVLLFGIAILALTSSAVAQRPPAWSDDLVDKLVGTWDLHGDVLGHPAHHRTTAHWALAHHFLEVHEETSPGASPSEAKYDAIWYLGYDDVTGHCVLHLMDLFGGRFSETLGDGTRIGNQLRFSFPYPDGPFRTSWTWHPESKSWRWHMERSGKSGKWLTFADFLMEPSQSH